MEDDSDHQSSESGALIANNDDLLIEILLQLPVKSIIRFKSVSKHWRWLLSHRSFTIRYDHKLSKSPGVLAGDMYVPFDVKKGGTSPFRSLDSHYDPCGFKIVQSCNGLLLCSSYGCSTEGSGEYYVFNPTTRQFAIVPSVPGGPDVHKAPAGELFQIQIYSSETKKWKISIESFSVHKPTFSNGVYWNGAFHWAPSYRNHLCFKFDVERLQLLPLPVEMMPYGTLIMYFGESRGHLHLVLNNYRKCFMLHLDLNVYEMLSDHSGWVVKYHIVIDELVGAFPEILYPFGYAFEVVDVVRGEEEEDTFIVLITSSKMITYNVHDSSFKQICNLSNYLYYGYSSFHRYIETLASF
ncbi:hypothetical protein SSX86_027964 [Deinandra increscens subsp. villosa]|uniref:F-box domain-containing protein n=1 Tax=Deinandra increscens subsp. villosa TaxID=3103831 RepID=A0AAP0CD77_9ASTR